MQTLLNKMTLSSHLRKCLLFTHSVSYWLFETGSPYVAPAVWELYIYILKLREIYLLGATPSLVLIVFETGSLAQADLELYIAKDDL